MTHTNETMRQRLAEAMGWTDMIPIGGGEMWGCGPLGHYCRVPDPLESDRDAALLRAWCVEQWFVVEMYEIAGRCQVCIGPGHHDWWSTVYHDEEPDFLRRERLALCRAVLVALEVE